MLRLKATLTRALQLVPPRLMGSVTHFAVPAPVVALTFDDGPHPEYTPRVLDILARSEVRATFFMIGTAAQKHPELVRKIAAAGHAVGNHSWDHTSFTAICGRERRNQIRACHRALSPHGSRILRPPWDNQNLASRLDAYFLRHQVISWSLDVGDWWDHDSRRMAESLCSAVRPGSVILLHDSIFCPPLENGAVSPLPDREPMLKALASFLEHVTRTFRFATVPEMFQCGRPIRRNWYET